MQKRIATYVINLEKRTDRKRHIVGEFLDKPEFDVRIVNGIEDMNGGRGLWMTISNIVRNLINTEDDFFLLVEDDHQFTNRYDVRFFWDAVERAESLGAEILLGGVSWFGSAVRESENLFAVNLFNATQFVIVFKSFYKKTLNNLDNYSQAADVSLSKIAKKKFVIYPFISVQKEFGYSDATSFNERKGYVTEIFSRSKKRLECLNRVLSHYEKLSGTLKPRLHIDTKNRPRPPIETDTAIPLYFVSDQSIAAADAETNRIRQQFGNKKEFQLKLSFLKSAGTESESYKESEQLVAIVKEAQIARDDVIIVARSNFALSSDYSSERLFEQIVDAQVLDAKVLFGNATEFCDAIYLSNDIFWVRSVSSSFVVLYKCIFDAIIRKSEHDAHDMSQFDTMLSSMTSNKFITHHFTGFDNLVENGGKYQKAENLLRQIQSASSNFGKNHPLLNVGTVTNLHFEF